MTDLQTKYQRLVDKVRMMRGTQKEYMKYRAGIDRERARRLEREVDKMIEEELKEQKQSKLL